MNPDTNKFEKLEEKGLFGLIRPDGSPVPKHWSIFTMGEEVTIKDYLFRVAYIGESAILFEPVGPQVLANDEEKEMVTQSCPRCGCTEFVCAACGSELTYYTATSDPFHQPWKAKTPEPNEDNKPTKAQRREWRRRIAAKQAALDV